MLALIARVKNLLLSPGSEWDVIDREEVDPRRLALRYVAPLALLPALATVIALAVVGVPGPSGLERAPWVGVAIAACMLFVLSIAAVFAFAWLINAIAPRFGAERNFRQAFKLAAYSTTAALLAGLLAIAPALQVFALIASTYSLYLLFVGAPKLMHPKPAAAVNYSITAVFSAILIALAVGLPTMFVASPSGNPFPQFAQLPFFQTPTATSETGQPQAPRTEGSAVLRPGGGGTISNGDLRGAVPETLVGLNKVAVGVERSGQEGSRTLKLEAEYRDSARGLSLQIVYSPAIAPVIGFGGAGTSEFDRETADGYSRRRRVDNAIIVEDWNSSAQAGSYGRLVDDKFYVKATGRGVSPEDLRAAVELFGQETLAQFAAGS